MVKDSAKTGCPFKYETDEYHDYIEGMGMPGKTGKKYLACDMRNASECVGEEICPIMKK